MAAAALVLAGATAQAAELLGVRFGPSEVATRVVFDLAGPAPYEISGDDEGEGRIFVRFEGLSVPPAQRGAQTGKGHVAGYAFAIEGDGAAATLTLDRTARIKEHFVLPANAPGEKTRVVLDLETADRAAFLASLPERAGGYQDIADVIKAATAAPTAAAQAPAKPVIVVDAGHGGSDPGAVGPNGTHEKTVTLAAALELAKILESRGRYEVVLTRDKDTKIGLEKRSELAREAGASLFISLHADAHENSKLRGGSVYTLSEKGSRRSALEARRKGDYHVYSLDLAEFSPDVSSILFAKAQATTRNASSDFADVLVSHLSGVTPLLNNSHRTGDLYVLLAPDVPAVLFELAFISNKADEANLVSPEWRRRAMTSVADAIDDYFARKSVIRQAARQASGAH
ncbi:N-acetylmuramoyl-L-alanine amidase family protein [Amphiplicatus metriothermophilus]|uniref:N-acetylmuramoyl-L-alanine amidase n=1 Tax=Amphiplicatus metriothermophilus TaxID=1519374 RepID=A0A239Q142_9PROT|nr:N-acetylmuramoyl-L-alanine amidase [Amphiplicatus metriothermophilus]MBB5520166.1 N-acetylmuramoyl-L-alanine amidase [Amphiplicatus metriothermophilus]SNT75922.1 N-acetylmuramoyl-L-alanine amidase [Amphiplicatus metriothermophilus]